MTENNIRWPYELNQDALNRFLEDLPARLAASGDREEEEGRDDDETVSVNAACNTIGVIFYIWRQRRCLEEAGIKPMPSQPWPGESVNGLARQISDQVRGWIQPLPDEVAVPLLNRAMWFLGRPADDVLRLQAELSTAYDRESGNHFLGPGDSGPNRRRRQKNAARDFQFSTLDGQAEAWHENLSHCFRLDGSRGAVMRATQLVESVQTACCLVLHGLTGMRVSELCGLRAGVNSDTGLPTGVEARISPTGINEEFILWSELSKGQRSPRDAPWLLGSRHRGDGELPPTIKALLVLNQLLAPYRALLASDRLLVSLRSAVGLPKTKKGVSPITADRLRNQYGAFIGAWIDLTGLPDQSRHATTPNDLERWRESRGGIITTHQLRKTYALYVLSVHPQLLPAVKRQFQHLSMAITEGGYWGNHAPQIEPMHSVSRQLTARMLFEVVQGRSSPGGKMGKQIIANLDALRAQVADLGMGAAWRLVFRWVEANDIHANHGMHGTCIPLVASRMECWKRAGTRVLGRLEPNYETREASLCAGCSCFALDAIHVPFWRDRYVDYEAARRQYDVMGLNRPDFRMARERAKQAMKILRDLGEDLAALEPRIEVRMNDHA